MTDKLQEFLAYLRKEAANFSEADNDTLYHQWEVEELLENILKHTEEILAQEGISDGVPDSENTLVKENRKAFPDQKRIRCAECDSAMLFNNLVGANAIYTCSASRNCPAVVYYTLADMHYPI